MNILREYRKMAESGEKFRGLSLLQHSDRVLELIQAHGSKTLLDYGCGAGDQYKQPHLLHETWGVERPTLFDPAFKHNRPPSGRFDGVICSDVLEHVPSNQVQPLLRSLLLLSTGWVFASVCCRPASKTFPNGKNLHLTVEPFAWWIEQRDRALTWHDEHHGNPPQFVLVDTP